MAKPKQKREGDAGVVTVFLGMSIMTAVLHAMIKSKFTGVLFFISFLIFLFFAKRAYGRKHDDEIVWEENHGDNGVETLTSYKKGKVHSIERWKPNGEKCPHSHVMNGNGVLVFYNPDSTEMKPVSYQRWGTVRTGPRIGHFEVAKKIPNSIM